MSERRYGTTFRWAAGEHGVTQFFDAEKALPYTVTKEHCQVAIRKDANGCPIQVSVREQESGGHVELVDVAVIRSTAMVVYRDKNHEPIGVRYRLAGPSRDAMISFDRSGVFVPGDYELYPVTPSKRMEAPRKRGNERGPHKTKSKHMTQHLPGLRVGINAKGGNGK